MRREGRLSQKHLCLLSQQVSQGSPEAVPVTSQEVEEMLQETQEACLDKLSMASELLIKCGEHLLKGNKKSEREGKTLLDAVQETWKQCYCPVDPNSQCQCHLQLTT